MEKHYLILAIVGVALLGLLLLFRFIKVQRLKLKELEALGLAKEKTQFIRDKENPNLKKQVVKRTLKIKKTKSKITFFEYNPAFGLADFEGLKDRLETIYNIKIDYISKEKPPFFLFWKQTKIVIHFNSLKPYLIDKVPKLKKGEIFAGFNSIKEPCILDTIEDCENTLLILGQKGSGKSVLARSIIYSFFEAYQKQEHELLIVDYKGGNDFYDLAEKYKATIINPSTIEGLKKIVGFFETNKREFEKFARELETQKISLKHFDLAKTKGLNQPRKYFFVMDEAKQYLANVKEPKVSKDPTDDEREELEKFKLKKRLSLLIDNFTDTQRVSGSVLLILSQDSRSGEYLFNFTNFKTMFISQQNKAQSIALTGSNIAEDKDLKKGKFIAIANGKIEKIQSPNFLELKK